MSNCTSHPEPAAGFGGDPPDRPGDGTLSRPFTMDCGGTRNLFFTLEAVQSSMRVDDPNALVAPYTRKMMAFLLFRPAPRHVLMIGLGGGSLAKFCYHHLPRTRVSVVEISTDVIALRDHFAIPRDDERFEVIHDDGATFLEKSSMTPDVVLIDAFDDVGVSPSLASPDFYKEMSRRMMPGGVLVMNLSGRRSRYAAHVQGVQRAFPGLVRLVPVDGEDNLLLFAFGQRPASESLDRLHQRAQHLERCMGLEFSRYLERLRAGHVLDERSSRA